MDRSWRPRPIQGNNCPTCLISHFPFCSPHPQFHQNPRFQSHDDLTFQRPHFDPFLDHRGPTPGLHPPFIGNPNDGFGDPRPWHRNPSLERESFGQFHGQSQIGDPHRYDHVDTGFKRMRVDENGIGSFTNDSYMNVPRISVENERRLKLIRDHGGVTSESKGYDQESSDFGRSFGNTDFGGYGNYGELRGSGNDMALENPISFKLNNFGDQDFDNFGRKEDRGLASAPHYMSSSEKEELGRLRFESSLNPSLQIDVRKGLPIGGPPIVKQGGQGEDMDLFYNEGGAPYKSNLGEVYSSHIPKSDLNQLTQMSQFRSGSYPTSEVPSDNYYNRNLDFLPLKETQHPHPLSGSSAPYHGQRSNFPMENQNPMQQLKYDFRSAGQLSGMRQSFEVNFPPPDRNQGRIGHNKFSSMSKYGNNMGPEHMGPMEPSRAFNVRPPLPASPPPPLPADPHGSSSPPRTSSSLFPIHLSSSATGSSSYPPVPDHSLAHPSSHNKLHLRASAGVATEESQVIQSISSKKYLGQRRQFPPRHLSLDKTKVVDASHIFNQPHRAQRPDHIVIILRGLPGSGKSYLAKMLRDIEVENGGDAPRIHSMDEYFMTEVEKVEENEVSKSSASGRGKKPVTKKVMEYCYEPEMEEAYRSSMLKAFKKTLEEGVFSFIIVDDRNLRVADFAQFWAIAKRSGYEVYLLEATYKDPAGCAARNVHGFSQDDIERMARHWEEAPSLYLKLDIKSLFHGDDLKESGIQEVDMDTEDGGSDGGLSGFEERNPDKTMVPPGGDNASDGSSKHENGRNADIDHPIEVKELGSSKWSADFDDDDDDQRTEASKGNLSSLSGLIQAYGKEGKSVHWGDQVGNSGFSIGAAKKASALSLVIGPGIGYNLKSNPLSEDVNQTTQNSVESKGQSKFQERLRAERESFKAVFDKRRQRISGFYLEDE